MTVDNIDLAELAKQLNGNADELATEAATARADAKAAAAEPSVTEGLDPLFADKLELSLAPARRRLQDIAKRSA